MARYSIFDGGNLRLYPWENDRNSGIDPSYLVRYSAHLTNFHKVLRYHIDFSNTVFNQWVQDTLPTGKLEVGDELVTHLFGPGTVLEHFAVQSKGIPPTVGVGGDPPPTPPTFTIEVQAEDGTVLHSFGDVTLDSLGYIPFIGVDVFIPTNGFLVVRLDEGDASYSCFGLLASLVQLLDGHACDCVIAPCGAEFPDPNCAPAGLPGADDQAGTGIAGSDATITVTGTPPAGTVAVAYTTTFAASGGATPYVWSVSGGTVPPGLTLNTSTGVLAGTPSTAGSYTFTVNATDANTASGGLQVTVVIAAE